MKSTEIKKHSRIWLWGIAACLIIAVAAVAVYLSAAQGNSGSKKNDAQNTAIDNTVDYGWGLHLLDVAPYSGPYVEDGSDETVENIVSIIVKNEGTEDVQLATLTLKSADGTEYSFTLTALPAGKQVTLLETNRAPYQEELEVLGVVVSDVAGFNEPISLHEELLRIDASNRTLTVKNISGESFPGGRVFYKNISVDGYLGGITYTVTIPAMAVGEETSLYTGHYIPGNSELLFVTYAA